jgi:VWFA-related protein
MIEPSATPGEAAAGSERITPNLRLDTNLVLIPVTTPLNMPVTGLEKEHFRIFKDKQEQEITSFACFDAPLSVGLVFDASGSMGAKLNKSRQAAAEFFKTANPEDEFFLVRFSDRPRLVMPFTQNTEDVQSRLAFTASKGRTALLDGIYLALQTLKKSRNPRRALLIISDGGDHSSRYTGNEVRNVLHEADAQMYAIGIYEPIGARGRTAEELSGPGLLSEPAEMTGGRPIPVENLNDLPDVARKIGVELRNQYVIGYPSRNLNHDGKYRRVTVKLNQPRNLAPLRANHRMGYCAPAQQADCRCPLRMDESCVPKWPPRSSKELRICVREARASEMTHNISGLSGAEAGPVNAA